MKRSHLLTATLVVSLVLAGCSGVIPGDGGSGPSSATPTATKVAEISPTASATGSPTATQSATPTPTAEPTATATPEYEAPTPQNTPYEGKHRDDGKERIRSVRLVNAEQTDSGTYSNFDLEVDADTRMPDVDPANHGDVEGEPYFLLYVDGELVERSDYVAHRNGTFTVTVHPGGLKQFEDGPIELKLLLMDRDSTYDDVYGVWQATIEYESDQ